MKIWPKKMCIQTMKNDTDIDPTVNTRLCISYQQNRARKQQEKNCFLHMFEVTK